MKIKNIGADKLLHFTSSIVLTCMVALVCVMAWSFLPMVAAFVGANVSFIVGLLKEFVWDRMLGRGTFELEDILSDPLGAFVGFLLVWGLLSACTI